MPNNNLPTIAQLQDPAWLKSQSQRVQTAVFHATEGKHRAKNDVVKLNSNYVQRRAADKRWKETHPTHNINTIQQHTNHKHDVGCHTAGDTPGGAKAAPKQTGQNIPPTLS